MIEDSPTSPHRWERDGKTYVIEGEPGRWRDWRCAVCDRGIMGRPGAAPDAYDRGGCRPEAAGLCRHVWIERDVVAVTIRGEPRERWEFGCAVCGDHRQFLLGKGAMPRLRQMARRRAAMRAAVAPEPTWPVPELESVA